MSIYQEYRAGNSNYSAAPVYATPSYAATPYAPSFAGSPTEAFAPSAPSAALNTFAAELTPEVSVATEEKGDDAILSQAEIDALLAGM